MSNDSSPITSNNTSNPHKSNVSNSLDALRHSLDLYDKCVDSTFSITAEVRHSKFNLCRDIAYHKYKEMVKLGNTSTSTSKSSEPFEPFRK